MKNKSLLILLTLLVQLSGAYASETVEGAKKDYESFKIEMSAKLDHVESEIKLLKEKAKDKTSQSQSDSIQELEKTKAKLKSELNDMKQTGNSSWKKFKANFAASVDKLNSKIQTKLKD